MGTEKEGGSPEAEMEAGAPEKAVFGCEFVEVGPDCRR